MYNFAYQRPSSLADAEAALKGADDGKIMAGGQTLLPTLKQRLANPSDVIDIGRIAELSGIAVAGGVVTIGATTRHADVAGSAEEKVEPETTPTPPAESSTDPVPPPDSLDSADDR